MESQSAVTTCQFSDKDRPYHSHTHLSCELIYVKSGAAKFHISGKTYTVHPGTVVFINTLEEHSVELVQQPYERYFMSVSSALLEKQVRNPKLTSIFKNRPKSFCHCFPVQEDAAYVESLLQQIQKEYHTCENFSPEYIGCLLEQLLILLYRRMPSNFPLPDKLINNEVIAVQHYIERHFTEPISILRLAEEHYISPDYLSHTFKQLTGYSPKQYILLNRLAYARELVLQSSTPIGVISYKCGFGDVNNFIRSYKKQFGCTPAAHRKI